jgi:selenide, water dikinase
MCCSHAADGGFLAINKYLQSDQGPPEVFAAGDVATSVVDPRPKAGVFAVRQGQPLAENLRRFLAGQPLKPFHPQNSFLGLISMGAGHAIATRGFLAFSGNWLWTLKDHIDRAFIRKFGSDLPDMGTSMEGAAS